MKQTMQTIFMLEYGHFRPENCRFAPMFYRDPFYILVFLSLEPGRPEPGSEPLGVVGERGQSSSLSKQYSLCYISGRRFCR